MPEVLRQMTPKEELEHIQAEEKRLEARKREIYKASLEAPENEKVCEDHLAGMLAEDDLFPSIQYPLTIQDITVDTRRGIHSKGWRGQICGLVKIRPVQEEYEGKTFLGLHLGDLATTVGASFNSATGVLSLEAGRHNPAIYVPDLQKVIFGYESWWGPIKSEEELDKVITDEDIQNIWYVKALKQRFGGPKKDESEDSL